MNIKNKHLKVVILAGGYGTRLSEYTKTIPKPMVKIKGIPIIKHIINHYKKFGFQKFIIASGYKGKVIKNSLLRLKRDNEVIYEGKLTSLKRFKDDVNEVLENFDCGIGIDNFTEFKEKDIIEVYELKEVKRKLK